MAVCCGNNWNEIERHLMEQETTRKINEEARIENEKARLARDSRIEKEINQKISDIESRIAALEAR